MQISIIGKSGDLAKSLNQKLSQNHSVTCYSKNTINFDDLVTVTNHIPSIAKSDVVIICSGTMSESVSRTMKVNAIGPIHLINELITQHCKAQIIVIGSHGATWTSWPGISTERLLYNISKKCLMDYILGLEQSQLSEMKLTIYNVSRFQSTMSNQTGVPIEEVVDQISWLILQKNPPLVLECGKTNDS